MDVQQNGGVVAYIHIGSALIRQHVHEAVTFSLPWKRGKERKRHDTIWKIGAIAQRIFTRKGKDGILHSWGEAHVQREEMEGIQERGGEETFYVGEGKQVRERASKERCLD